MSEIVIANGVTLEAINPRNCALKTDYLDNLLTTAFSIFPRVASVIGDRRITVIRGYLPYAYIMQEMTEAPDKELLKHAKGKAFVFSWENFKEHEAFILARLLYDELPGCHVIIDGIEQTVYCGLGFNRGVIIHVTANERRVIAKQAA